MLLLAPPLVGLFYVAVAEPSGRSMAKTAAHAILAAVKDPLALFSERSPGLRIAGRLLSTKDKTGPHERVLSTVRDREQPAAPVADNFIPDDSTSAIPIVPPQYDAPPTDHTLDAIPFVPSSPYRPPTSIPFIPGGIPTSNPPQANTPQPPEGPNGPNPPGPPDGPNPPGPPTTPPDTPPTITIPEPPTWALLLAGILACVAAGGRRKLQIARRR